VHQPRIQVTEEGSERILCSRCGISSSPTWPCQTVLTADPTLAADGADTGDTAT
jgi:hypothetical protein